VFLQHQLVMQPLACGFTVHFEDIAKYGGMIGLGVIPLLTQWKNIGGTLKSVIHPKPEIESKEPLSYRWAWIGFAASSVLTLVMLSIGGMPLWLGIVFLLIFNVLTIGLTRLRGESGGWIGNADEFVSTIQATLYQIGFESGIKNTAVQKTAWSSLMLAGTYTWWGTTIALPPPVTSMEAFKMASITNTKTKDLFVSISIAIVISLLIGVP
jgi:hypothetical protein